MMEFFDQYNCSRITLGYRRYEDPIVEYTRDVIMHAECADHYIIPQEMQYPFWGDLNHPK